MQGFGAEIWWESFADVGSVRETAAVLRHFSFLVMEVWVGIEVVGNLLLRRVCEFFW
jgi:hypothetical protein